MGKIIITDDTPKNPITMIGKYAGECWGADTTSDLKNFRRGVDCINSEHGRTWEFPDVYMTMEGYSARVIREWYTHIGGAPTRLQASTRYINYEKGFDYIIPTKIAKNPEANQVYNKIMADITEGLQKLEELGIPREDSAMGLPLGMTTKIACKHNFRNLVDMSHQRMCNRAYWEYRQLYGDLIVALGEYSDEWKLLTQLLKPKCEVYGYCNEKNSCGRVKRKEKPNLVTSVDKK